MNKIMINNKQNTFSYNFNNFIFFNIFNVLKELFLETYASNHYNLFSIVFVIFFPILRK